MNRASSPENPLDKFQCLPGLCDRSLWGKVKGAVAVHGHETGEV
jgi:hypothetical protein